MLLTDLIQADGTITRDAIINTHCFGSDAMERLWPWESLKPYDIGAIPDPRLEHSIERINNRMAIADNPDAITAYMEKRYDANRLPASATVEI